MATALRGQHVTGSWPVNLCTAKDVARQIGITETRVRELADAHVIPHWRVDGGDPLFRVTEVRTWLAQTQILERYDGKPLPLSFIVATEVPALATELPPPLRPMAGDIRSLPIPGSRPGVYFLCSDMEIVYVGQSTCPAARVAQHEADRKIFDRAFVLPCLPEHLSLLEGYFIRALQPRGNGNRGPIADPATVAALFPNIAAAVASLGIRDNTSGTTVATGGCQP